MLQRRHFTVGLTEHTEQTTSFYLGLSFPSLSTSWVFQGLTAGWPRETKKSGSKPVLFAYSEESSVKLFGTLQPSPGPWNQSLRLEPPLERVGHPLAYPPCHFLFGYSGSLSPTHSNHLNRAGQGKAAHPPTHSHQSPRSRAEGAAGHLPRAARFLLEPEAGSSAELVSCRGKAGSLLGEGRHRGVGQ